MIIKVCGIKDIAQMRALDFLKVQYVGINFYKPSPRYYDGVELKNIHIGKIKKVGIVVDLSTDEIKELIDIHELDAIQLHGHETPDKVNEVAKFTEVIKAFPHTDLGHPGKLKEYVAAKYYLFDTATKDHGGSGIQFDWKILESYEVDKPFLLAGGIKADDTDKINELKKIKHFAGVDLNSKFEIEPGRKDLNKIQSFIKLIRQ
jgi:phosphoribosylanthranilate isomerase